MRSWQCYLQKAAYEGYWYAEFLLYECQNQLLIDASVAAEKVTDSDSSFGKLIS